MHFRFLFQIEKGANVDAPLQDPKEPRSWIKGYQETPLTLAITMGYTNIVSLLLEANACVTFVPAFRPAMHAVLAKTESTKDQNSGNSTEKVLTDCEEAEMVEIVKMLLAHGADVNEQIIPLNLKDISDRSFHTPLGHACLIGCLQVVEFLITKGADVNLHDATNGTPIYYACKGNHLNIVQVLAESGVEPLLPGKVHERKCPLLSACQNGNIDIVKILLKLGYSTDVATFGGDYYPPVTFPIQAACRGGHIDVVKILLESGADVNATFSCTDPDPYDNRRLTTTSAITQAAYKGSEELINLLIRAGADINIQEGEDKDTPIMTAVHYENYEGCDALLEAGADVNIFDKWNNNPLLTAIRWFEDGHRLIYDIANRTDSAHVQDGIIVSHSTKYKDCVFAEALDKKKYQSILQLLKSGVDLGLEPWYVHNCYDQVSNQELMTQLDDYYFKHNSTLLMITRRYILKQFTGYNINTFNIPESLKRFLKYCHF